MDADCGRSARSATTRGGVDFDDLVTGRAEHLGEHTSELTMQQCREILKIQQPTQRGNRIIMHCAGQQTHLLSGWMIQLLILKYSQKKGCEILHWEDLRP